MMCSLWSTSTYADVTHTDRKSSPPLLPTDVSSSFIKTDAQTMAGRIAAQGGAIMNKRRKVGDDGEDRMDEDDDEDDADMDSTQTPASRTIVIHPGSTHIRVGLASDVAPVVWPNVLARRGATTPTTQDTTTTTTTGDASTTDTPLDSNIALIRADLRSIMRNMKLRGVSNGRASAANYNATVQPETIPSHNDLQDDWTPEGADVELGERALMLASLSPKDGQPGPQAPRLFRPLQRGSLNRSAYNQAYGQSAEQALSADLSRIIAAIITATHERDLDAKTLADAAGKTLHGLGIPRRDLHLYSAILIVPDCFPRDDVRLLVQVLLQDLAFAQLIVQQESTAATFGAGMSSACVVHLGGQRGSISCIDEGLLLQDTRIHLDYGGQDVTEFLYALLRRINLPYKQCSPRTRITDHLIVEDLKKQMCTLDVTQLGLAIYNHLVRFPNTPTRKYEVRVYDETVIAPMLFFGTGVRVVDFASRHQRERDGENTALSASAPFDDEEEAEREVADAERSVPVTAAMTASVRHLLPQQQLTVASATPAASPAPADGAAETRESSVVINGGDAPSSSTSATQAARTRRQATLTQSSQQPLDVALLHSLLTSAAAGGGGPAVATERLKKLAANILVIGGSARIMGVGAAIEAR